jgi:glycosyltransferase involved in cell wall biosynthesis
MANEAAEITVLIPVRNGARFVADAVRSALEQDVARLQVMVSDNQSSDDTPRILERLAADPRVILVRQPAALSMAQHFNHCLGRVATKYYMLLCHDDYLASPDGLRIAHDVLVSQPDVNAVYCDMLFVDARGKPIMTRTFGRSGRFDAATTARASVVAARNLFGIPLLVRTRAARGLAYDETLPYTADVDLSIASGAGGALFHLPRALIANRYHPQNATWATVGDVAGQMQRIAAKHGISLSAFDCLRLKLNASRIGLMKLLLRAYLILRR